MAQVSKTMTDQLRQELQALLAATEEYVANAEKAKTSEEAKKWIRKAHFSQRETRLQESKVFIAEKEDDLLHYFADGREVDPTRIDPVVTPVVTQHDKDLWRYASLTWSVPVSEGYGRRTKFLVRDRHNNKLIAIFALGDPVIGLGPRDEAIGWDKEQRHARLYNVYDAFVLGAVDPYRQLLAGKLVALLSLANETRAHLTAKYSGTTTVLREEKKNPTPVLITTSSALGRSSIYNRLTFFEHKAFQSVGYTRGFGHFHIPDEIFQQLVLLIKAEGSNIQSAYGRGETGGGANYRFRVIRTALKELGIPASALRHGVQREVFLAPVAQNWKEYLCGATDLIEPVDMPTDEVADYYRLRWAVPRAQRRPDFQKWNREELRLSQYIEGISIQLSMTSEISRSDEITSNPIAQYEILEHEIQIDTRPGEDGTTELVANVGEYKCCLARREDRNGAVTLRASEIAGNQPMASTIFENSSLTFRTAPLQQYLLYADLKVLISDSSKGPALRTLRKKQLEELLGKSLEEALPRSSGVIVGTRAELLRDESRRANQLCAMFARDNHEAAGLIWSVIRPVSLLASIEGSEE